MIIDLFKEEQFTFSFYTSCDTPYTLWCSVVDNGDKGFSWTDYSSELVNTNSVSNDPYFGFPLPYDFE